MSDASDAGALASDIGGREIAPHVDMWGAPDGPGVPDGVRRPFGDAGLLDPDLPASVAVEVALALGRCGLQAALTVQGVDLATAGDGDRLRAAASLAGAAGDGERGVRDAVGISA